MILENNLSTVESSKVANWVGGKGNTGSLRPDVRIWYRRS
jgi:hypothetical protein